MSSRSGPSYPPSSSGDGVTRLNTGAIIGIVIGCVIALILACAVAYIRRLRRQAALQQAQAATRSAVLRADRVEQAQRAAVARGTATAQQHNPAPALQLHQAEVQRKQHPSKQVQPLPYSGMEMTAPPPYAPTIAPVQPQHITIHVGAPRKLQNLARSCSSVSAAVAAMYALFCGCQQQLKLVCTDRCGLGVCVLYCGLSL